MIKELREATGAGILDCKKALEKAEGDMEKAKEYLREKGLAIVAQKAGRETREGIIGVYVHTGSRIAAMVEVNCETDFVARTKEFQELAHDLAMQVAALRPRYLSPEDIPAEEMEAQKELYRREFQGQNKPPHIVEKIVEGKMRQFYEEVCLLHQPFIKDGKLTIQDLINQAVARLGENITVRRFVRFELGEE